jgi:hypothetical protein
MDKYYVTYTIYLKDETEPLTTFTNEYRHQSEIDIRMKDIREFGFIHKLNNNEIDWYPTTAIGRVNYKTFVKNE